VPEHFWCQPFSGARAFLVSALFWYQSVFGVSTFLVPEPFWCHIHPLTGINNLANVLSSGQVRAGGRDASTSTWAERDCPEQMKPTSAGRVQESARERTSGHAYERQQSSVGTARAGKVRKGRADEPINARRTREGAKKRTSFYAEERQQPGRVLRHKRKYGETEPVNR
jgi:hypothetical protein